MLRQLFKMQNEIWLAWDILSSFRVRYRRISFYIVFNKYIIMPLFNIVKPIIPQSLLESGKSAEIEMKGYKLWFDSSF